MKCSNDCHCDQCLINQMQTPDETERRKGWEAWYRRDYLSLRTLVERRCRAWQCLEHSQDIIQDSFIIGFENIASGRYQDRGKSLNAYLCGIAKNLIHEVFRLQMKEVSSEAYIDSLASDTLRTDDKIVLEEILVWVEGAYDQQPNLHRRVIDGLYAQGKSSDELGQELCKTATHTRTIAHRTVETIRMDLKRRHNLCLSTDVIRTCLKTLLRYQNGGHRAV